MLLTSGQISVAISSGVGKPPLTPTSPPLHLNLLTTRSLHLHNAPLPLRLHTATANRALSPTRPAPSSSSPHARRPRHKQPRAAETSRPTPRAPRLLL